MPIWFGPLRGKRWITGSSLNKCWLGIYEYPKQLEFAKRVLPGQVVYDIGANVGFYTLLASFLVGPQGKVIAFEPVPRNLEYIAKHLEINGADNVAIVAAAVSDTSGAATFAIGRHHTIGHLSDDGSLQVELVSLDECVYGRRFPVPGVLKLDIEGSEYLALSGAASLLNEHHPTVFLATHGVEVHNECCEYLERKGYKLEAINGGEVSDSIEIVATYRR